MTRNILSAHWLVLSFFFLTISFLSLGALPNFAHATSIATYSPTGDPYVDGVLTGVKWATNSLTFSFPATTSNYGTNYGSGETLNNFAPFSVAQQDAARKVLAMYSASVNVTFTEVTETDTNHGEIRYAQSGSPSTAWAYYPSTGAAGGDVWVNTTYSGYDNPAVGSYGWETFQHETGHAMGLKHPHDVNGSFPAMPVDKDSLEYSVMSYRSYIGASVTSGYTNNSSSYPQKLMLFDIAGLQQIYGANYSTNNSDTVYSWSPTTGQASINGISQGTLAGNHIFLPVWDGGGNDTYDFSNFTKALSVNLKPGSWTTVSVTQLADLGGSPTHYAAGNIANALLYKGNPASLIENAIGGMASDTIMGNDVDNTLTGKGGDDYLDGSAGNNTAVYSGPAASYLVTQNGDGSWSVTDQRTGSPDGTDTVRNIQVLSFSDGPVTIGTPIPVNHAPVAVNDAYGVDENTSLTVSSAAGVLANDSDQDSNPLTAILVTQPLHGTLSLSSNGSFSYTPVANYYGADSFSYKANDGSLNSNTASVSINVQQVIVPDTSAPSTTISSPSAGATVSNTVSITATATDNVGVTKVELYKDGLFVTADTSSPYTWSWDTTVEPNGSHTLQTRAFDATGNVGLSPAIGVTVSNITVIDTTPPAVSITSPVNGAKLKGNGNVSIQTSASDASGIASIVINVDGVSVKTCSNATSCSYSWSGKSINPGTHTIVAIATDNSANRNTNTTSVTVTK